MIQRGHVNLILRTVGALAITAILVQFPLYGLEFLTYDLRHVLSPEQGRSGHVLTVAIDKDTMSSLEREPTPLEIKQVIQTIASGGANSTLWVSWPVKISGEPEEKKTLALAMESTPSFAFFADDIPVVGEESSLIPPDPFQKAKVYPGLISRDLKNFAADDVTRRAVISFEGKLLGPAELAQSFNGISQPMNYRGAFPFLDSVQTMIDFKPKNTYRAISFGQILKGNIDPKIFNGKLVLIGRDTESDSGDYIRTPFSKDILAMSRLEAHANILDTLILNSGVRKAPNWFNILVTTLISIFTSFVVFGMRPGKGLLVLALMVVSFCSVAYIGFAGFRFWIGMAHPLLAIFISYYFFIPYRLIQEYRKRWEYQQKHALITQVEELKTNFLSMMSHDLKTPLARIQGMTEMAMAQPQNLSETQVEALETINQSSDELSNFISSVLNLTRIESKELKLHLQSKDINQLLEDVVKKYQFLAKSKNIEIVMEMEPIFSTKVDVDLMKQVLGNLVENAIKYSPEGSRILVSTEEKENQIVIQVADQGVGIPKDEISNVFMKFYRSKNAKSSPVKGSGLGLYLAKYFVELHQGKISVESVPQEGSTFTVELPMDA